MMGGVGRPRRMGIKVGSCGHLAFNEGKTVACFDSGV